MHMTTEAPTAAHAEVQRAASATVAAPAATASPAAGLAGSAPTGGNSAKTGEYLTFRLGGEEYGIDILRVQEIRSYEPPTRIANAPDFIKGVVNLRGVIVPIIDLRLKLRCDTAEYNTFTVVVVLNVRGRVVGAVVDSVSDVLKLGRDDIKASPDMNSSMDSAFITGIGTVKTGGDSGGERMLILMDIEGLMSSADMGLINTH
jgi:purine-binding chemotaxis protein CheW